MIDLPDELQYLIWKSYFSHHILPELLPIHTKFDMKCHKLFLLKPRYFAKSLNIIQSFRDEWDRQGHPTYKEIYKF